MPFVKLSMFSQVNNTRRYIDSCCTTRGDRQMSYYQMMMRRACKMFRFYQSVADLLINIWGKSDSQCEISVQTKELANAPSSSAGAVCCES